MGTCDAVGVSETLSIIFRNLRARPSVDTSSTSRQRACLGFIDVFSSFN